MQDGRAARSYPDCLLDRAKTGVLDAHRIFARGHGANRELAIRVGLGLLQPVGEPRAKRDRKSTRLNSSHVRISYAVFCLKKKKKKSECDVYAMTDTKAADVVEKT